MQEKRLIGSLYGSGRPLMDIPHLVTLYQAGELKLRELVTRTYPLDGINDALARSRWLVSSFFSQQRVKHSRRTPELTRAEQAAHNLH
jgi:hypothetical protein